MQLTHDGIPLILSCKKGHTAPIYLQVLHFQRFIPDELYKSILQISNVSTRELEAFDVWLSDGKVQEKCTVHTKNNNLFTSGELIKYSIIQITKSRMVILDNLLTDNEVLIVEDLKIVNRLVTSTIHKKSSSSSSSSKTNDKHPVPSAHLWTDPSVPYARERTLTSDKDDKDNDKDTYDNENEEQNKGGNRVRDYKPLVGGRCYYVADLCDDPYGPLAFLPPNPRTEQIEEEEEESDNEENEEEQENENEGGKKTKKTQKYKLSPIFDGDIVALDDFEIGSNRVDIADVSKKQNKRKGKKAKVDPPTLIGVISSKSSIVTYGATSDMAHPMRFSITLSDITGSISLVFWNAMCRFFHFVEVGQVVAVRNFVVKKQYGGDGIELALNTSKPEGKIKKLKRKHFMKIPMPRVDYHFLPFVESKTLPDGTLFDCVGVVLSRSASERRRVPSQLPFSPTSSSFHHYLWIVLLNPPSTLASSEEGFAVRVSSNSQYETWNSLAVGQSVVLTQVRVASVTVDSTRPRITYGTTTYASRLYQLEGPYSAYVPASIRELEEVKQVVEWYGMGGWDDGAESVEDFTPHYVWYPTLYLYCLHLQDGTLNLQPFGKIESTKSSLKLKERTDLLVQCNILGIQEMATHFVVKLLDLNQQCGVVEATIPATILKISAQYNNITSNSLVHQLQRLLLGSTIEEDLTLQELVDEVAEKVFIVGVELFCNAWKEYSIDACSFYSPNSWHE